MSEVMRQIQQRYVADPEFKRLLHTDPLAAIAEYDLTEAERQNFVLPNFSWLIDGQVAGSGWPRTEAALAALHQQGIGAIISLNEPPPDAELMQKYGFASLHVPITDFTAPNLGQIEQVVDGINGFLAQGSKVLVHCAAGIGRTGTMLACYRVSQGATAEAAITEVRAKRPGSIETADQEAAVEQYAKSIKAN